MKGTFFTKPLEWSVETNGESWHQGDLLEGLLKVKNHGAEEVTLENPGIALAKGEIKKVHSKTAGALAPAVKSELEVNKIAPGEEISLTFSLKLPQNCSITDRKSSYYLLFGQNFTEAHLQLKITPYPLFTKLIGLLDTFHRFKVKEVKAAKKGVEYKLIPPSARDMANIESLSLNLLMNDENLELDFAFQVKKLDTASVTTKVSKENLKIHRELSPKEYSLGRDMINQDLLLKSIESVISEVKMKSVF